jgi:hypothetical protein
VDVIEGLLAQTKSQFHPSHNIVILFVQALIKQVQQVQCS